MSRPYVEQRELGSVLRRRAERGQRGDPLLSVTQTHGVIPQAEAGRRNISSEDKSAYWRVYPGDIAYNTMRMWQGASALSSHFGIVSPAYTVCTLVEGVSPAYLAYALKLPENVIKFGARSQGITSDVWNLRFDELSKISVPVVADDRHRKRIAEILSTVDEAIEQTEALISKTQRIRAGLMHDLFSRGVTPDGQLRPPREEAPQLYKESPLGWIPNKWDVTKLRGCLLENPTNGIYKPAELIGRGTLLVGQTSFTPERSIDYGLSRRAIVDGEEQRRYGLAEDDILITRVFATVEGVGRPVLVPPLPEAAVYESNMMKMRVNPDLIKPRLLFELLRYDRARKLLVRGINASNQCSVNQSVLNPLPVPRPLPDEQEQLIQMIRADDARHSSERSVLRKLKQLKSGVMHDLLTGRVPVSSVTPAHV